MYTVEAPSLGTQTGKFIIVRGQGQQSSQP
jgi:hypothetical protein